MSGFTPGPWVAVTDGDVPDVVVGDKLSIFYITGDEGNANARLIAAAPDMFDALESIRKHVAAQPSALAKAIEVTCDNALAKARGEQA